MSFFHMMKSYEIKQLLIVHSVESTYKNDGQFSL